MTTNNPTLPPLPHPSRRFFDPADLAAKLENRTIEFFRNALAKARQDVQSGHKAPIHFLSARADGQIWLCAVGPRGGWKKVWNFSRAKPAKKSYKITQ
jgi:hypothetical protein